MTIGKLTEEQRQRLGARKPEILRIIDEQAAQLAKTQAAHAELAEARAENARRAEHTERYIDQLAELRAQLAERRGRARRAPSADVAKKVTAMSDTPQKLTEEDRALLAHESPVLGPEAIRIIDAQAADLAVERAEHEKWWERAKAAYAQLAEARAEVEALRGDLRVTLDDLNRKIQLLQRAKEHARASDETVSARNVQLASTRIPGFQIRFDGPPGPESGRFVECETLAGKGINVGRWQQDGEYWLLVITATPESPRATAERCHCSLIGTESTHGTHDADCPLQLAQTAKCRAAAERAVLDACARLDREVMRIFASANPEEGYGSPFKCMAASVFRAELALRAVKP